jgi:4-hydroxy-tetrahydrodipicolinate synthase
LIYIYRNKNDRLNKKLDTCFIMIFDKKKFSGVFTAIITPFKNNKIDYQGLATLIEYQIKSNIKGIVVCGSTGEAQSLTNAEYMEIINFSVDVAAGKIKTIVGVPSNCTEKVIQIIKQLENKGIDAFLVCTPYYIKPSQDGIFAHFSFIDKNTSAPIIPYNVPSRCGVDIKNETMIKIMSLPSVVAIKDSSGKIERASILSNANSEVSILCGEDMYYAPFCAFGGDGAICVATNVFPDKFLELENAIRDNDLVKLNQLHYQILRIAMSLSCESNPIPIKYAISLLHKSISPKVRLPLTQALDSTKKDIEKLIQQL